MNRTDKNIKLCAFKNTTSGIANLATAAATTAEDDIHCARLLSDIGILFHSLILWLMRKTLKDQTKRREP